MHNQPMNIYLANNESNSHDALRMANLLNSKGHTVILEPGVASETNLAQGQEACDLIAWAYEETFYLDGAAR